MVGVFHLLVPKCSPDHSGQGYIGPQDHTHTGQPCASGSGVNYNTCANSGQIRQEAPWCFLKTNSDTWQLCDVPVCVVVRGPGGNTRIIT